MGGKKREGASAPETDRPPVRRLAPIQCGPGSPEPNYLPAGSSAGKGGGGRKEFGGAPKKKRERAGTTWPAAKKNKQKAIRKKARGIV